MWSTADVSVHEEEDIPCGHVWPQYGVHPYSLEGADNKACLDWNLGWQTALQELYTGNYVEPMYEVSPDGYQLKCLKTSPEQAIQELLIWCKFNPLLESESKPVSILPLFKKV